MEHLDSLINVFFGCLVLSVLWNIAASVGRIEAMLRRMLPEQAISGQVELEPSDRVKALAMSRKTYVDAIRAYREQTGLGLKQAKAVVDGLARGEG